MTPLHTISPLKYSCYPHNLKKNHHHPIMNQPPAHHITHATPLIQFPSSSPSYRKPQPTNAPPANLALLNQAQTRTSNFSHRQRKTSITRNSRELLNAARSARYRWRESSHTHVYIALQDLRGSRYTAPLTLCSRESLVALSLSRAR